MAGEIIVPDNFALHYDVIIIAIMLVYDFILVYNIMLMPDDMLMFNNLPIRLAIKFPHINFRIILPGSRAVIIMPCRNRLLAAAAPPAPFTKTHIF